MKTISIEENGLFLVLLITDDLDVRLLHFSSLPYHPINTDNLPEGVNGFRLVEVNISGIDRPEERHGTNFTVTAPGYRLKYKDYSDTKNSIGRLIKVVQHDAPTGLDVISSIQFFDGVPVARWHTTLINNGPDELGVDYLSSFALTGIEKEGLLPADEKLEIFIPHNAWQKEMIWQKVGLDELGMTRTQPDSKRRSSQSVSVSSCGGWSSEKYLPLGMIKNTESGTSLFWQIETNGSWHWEIGDQKGFLYLQLSGPSELYSHWYKILKPGCCFESVTAAVGSVRGGIDEVGSALTLYRRRIRRDNADNKKLPVIFNDYMNCMFGDPTTEKELPMIDRASEAGCEYYVIDAGWYSDNYWWDEVGEWVPSKKRFPGGIREVIDYIRKKGMVPGLWLEIEVMGINCPLATTVPDDWFFIRHGSRISDRSRYQLDFRNPHVREHASAIVDRLVKDYGIGYIKMDYNIECGIGTEINADSFGDGLLEHNRAYLSWIDSLFAKYPDLVIENCSSGGLRIDYAMLERHSIQSTSDQEDYRMYATISANAPMFITPEQAAVWSYPLEDGSEEAVIFNMVNSLLLRVHLSGHLTTMDKQRFSLVKEAIECYKTIRPDINESVPFWPIGFSDYKSPWVCLGLRASQKTYLAVWRRSAASDMIEIPLKEFINKQLNVCCIYPKVENCSYYWNKASGVLTVQLPCPYSARLFCINSFS